MSGIFMTLNKAIDWHVEVLEKKLQSGEAAQKLKALGWSTPAEWDLKSRIDMTKHICQHMDREVMGMMRGYAVDYENLMQAAMRIALAANRHANLKDEIEPEEWQLKEPLPLYMPSAPDRLWTKEQNDAFSRNYKEHQKYKKANG